MRILLILMATAAGFAPAPSLRRLRLPSPPPLSAIEDPAAPAIGRNGTRSGYAVTASLGVVSTGGAMPAVLMAADPVAFPTKSSARKQLRRGAVLLDGVEARCATNATAGAAIELQTRVAPGWQPRGVAPFPVDVAYEDDHVAIAIKPAGVDTHPPVGGSYKSRSMRTAIMYVLKAPPHLVHRLDKPTTGLMVAAKTKPALVALSRAFEKREVRKTYRAIVEGRVDGDSGKIDSPVDQKDARTTWRVTGRHRSLRLGGGHLTALELTPATGRTHQLRIHCADVLGCPIVGDKIHGNGGDGDRFALMLAAVALELDHPFTGNLLQVSMETPDKFGVLLAREGERFERLGTTTVGA